uniref:Uncharacterized protein n=1 Tax=Trichuris muris TaxID=70415 RepID=A0A5S6QI88_TRIMR
MILRVQPRATLLNAVGQCGHAKRAIYYWRKFERWQERVKALENQQKTAESQRQYFKGSKVYVTPEIESFAPPDKDPGNLSNVERGGMAFETRHYYARFRYFDLHPRTVRLYEEYQQLITHQYDQRFIPERHLLLGPDLAASHFIVHRGGSVKFVGDDRWHCMNKSGVYVLPGRQIPDLWVEGIDASNTALMFEGLGNLVDLGKLRFLSLRGCKFINDFCMSRMSQFENSLEFLDLSDCKKISAEALGSLSCLKKLKFLRLEGMGHVKNIALAALRLEDSIPQLKDNIGELYYVSGNLPEQPSLADDELPIFVSTIRKDPPALPLDITEQINRLSDGKLKHLLAGSPSGEWTQETERVLQVDARRLQDEGKAIHPFLEPNKPEDTSWKARLEQFAVRIELLEKNETLANLISAPRKSDGESALSPTEASKPLVQ